MFIPYSLTLLPDGWILEQYESLPHTVRATEVGHFWRGSLETDESNQSMFGEFLKRMMNMHVLNVQIKCQCLLRISYVFSIYKNVFTKMLFTFVYIDFRDIQLFFFEKVVHKFLVCSVKLNKAFHNNAESKEQQTLLHSNT